MILHSFWMASAPYRVRIGLNVKGLTYGYAAVDLTLDAQRDRAYRGVNPQALVPTLELDDGRRLTQSLAILEWLEETYPAPPLLPNSAIERAVVRAMCGIVACDIHPINNRRVMQAITTLGADDGAKSHWTERWIADGFDSLEPMIAHHGQGFAYGAKLTMADCCLVPQANNARRAGMDLNRWPALASAVAMAEAVPEVQAAHPKNQPDAR